MKILITIEKQTELITAVTITTHNNTRKKKPVEQKLGFFQQHLKNRKTPKKNKKKTMND